MKESFSALLEQVFDLADYLEKSLMDSALYSITTGEERITFGDLSSYMNENHHLFGKLKSIVCNVQHRHTQSLFSNSDIVWCSMFVHHTGKRFAELGYNSIFASLTTGVLWRNIADKFDELDKLIMRLRNLLGIL